MQLSQDERKPHSNNNINNDISEWYKSWQWDGFVVVGKSVKFNIKVDHFNDSWAGEDAMESSLNHFGHPTELLSTIYIRKWIFKGHFDRKLLAALNHIPIIIWQTQTRSEKTRMWWVGSWIWWGWPVRLVNEWENYKQELYRTRLNLMAYMEIKTITESI